MRIECAPLPLLDAQVGDDLREAVLRNRVRSEAVHEECMAKHKGVLQAVGAAVIPLATSYPIKLKAKNEFK